MHVYFTLILDSPNNIVRPVKLVRRGEGMTLQPYLQIYYGSYAFLCIG